MAIAGMMAMGLAVVGFASHWFFVGRWAQRTDNAYVRADISIISPQIEGYVRAVRALDNQRVQAGDPLIEINQEDYAAKLAAARAALKRAEGAYLANQAARGRASADLGRYRSLAQSGYFSASGMDAMRANALQAEGDAHAAAADIQAARAQVTSAELDLARTVIRAPIAGVVGNRVAQEGQLVRPGQQLMSIVPLDAVYVVANFKETQLSHMRAGQDVTLKVDAYPDLKLRGVVDSLAPASGAQFSLLPTDTATGNFTKIVQRVPVKVRLRLTPQERGLLRPGMSVVATVSTKPGRGETGAPAAALH
ncbi:MAG: HlyD family secretion protein [Hyphomonadaceae bacterium]